MQVRDGPAAVRGDAPPPRRHWATAWEGGGGGASSQKTCRRPAYPNPSRKEDSWPDGSRCSCVLSASSCLPRRYAATVKVRVEGKTQHALSARPRSRVTASRTRWRRSSRPRCSASSTTTSPTTSFGPYVDQVGLYGGDASSGWVFKVDDASPPVGADQVQLKDGDRVLWYYADVRPDRRAADARA